MKGEGFIIGLYGTKDRKRIYVGGYFNHKVFWATN